MCTRTCMATKTLTIMEDVYNLLLKNKVEGESFSEEIRKILSEKKKKSLIDFYGIISKDEGKAMLKDLKEIKEFNLKAVNERLL